MKRGLFFVLGFAVAIIAQAQTAPSNGGYFRVNQARGCAPLNVAITAFNLRPPADCNPSALCNIDFLGNQVYVLNQDNFTYNTPGIYRLTVVYNFGLSDYIDITVDPDIKPDFDVYTCSASGVSIRITDRNYQQYFVNFGDGSPLVTVPASTNQIAQHSYAGSGNFVIQVRGQKTNGASNCSPSVKPFQAVTNLPTPAFTQLAAIDAASAKIDFVNRTNVLHRMDIAVNSTNFQLYQTSLYNTGTFTATNLRLDDNYYCFRLNSYDICTGGNNYSPIICTQKVSLAIQNGSNKFDWQTTSTGVTGFDVYRNKAPYNLNLPTSATTFTDGLINCKTQYCYQVVAQYAGATSTSLEKCGISFLINVPSAPTHISSVVSGSQVLLTWDQNPIFTPAEYNVFKSISQGPFFLEGKTTAQQFSDNRFETNSQTCYKVNYTDKCDNNSLESAAACPLVLTHTLSPANEVNLAWNSYGGWATGVQSYKIEKFSAGGSLLATFTTTGNTLSDVQFDNVNQIVSYKVTAIANQAGVTPSTSNTVEVYKPVNLYFPTAFTPDSKGPKENETFYVGGQFISKIELSVFDRWGSLVFYTDQKEEWDGTRAGQPMPIATYVWQANVTDISGKTTRHNGTVMLIRK